MPDPRDLMAAPAGEEEDAKTRFMRFLMAALGQGQGLVGGVHGALDQPLPFFQQPGASPAAAGAPTSLTTPSPQPGQGLLNDLGARLNPWGPQAPSVLGQGELAARQEAEMLNAQKRQASRASMTPLEQAEADRVNRIARATPEELEAVPPGKSINPVLTPETTRGADPSKYGQYGTDMAGGTRPVGPGAAAGGGSFQGASGVNLTERPPDPNATYGAPSVIPGQAGAGGTSPQSLLGLPELGSLEGALTRRAGQEGTLQQYMENPTFAVYDMLTDAGANPSKNVYADYTLQKYGPILDTLATLAAVAGPENQKNAYADFVRQWAGGADMTPAIKAAIQKATGTGSDAERAKTALKAIPAGQLAKVISAELGESPMMSAVRGRTMGQAQMESMRAAQGRAQRGDITDDQKEWLQYLMGQLG